MKFKCSEIQGCVGIFGILEGAVADRSTPSVLDRDFFGSAQKFIASHRTQL